MTIRVERFKLARVRASPYWTGGIVDDNYYSGAVLVKDRVRENFEGTSYRQCHFGPLQDERGATTWFTVSEEWRKILIGGRYTILSGPAKGTTGIIKDITTRQVEDQGKTQECAYFVFDKEVPAGPPNTGILVEAIRLEEGDFRAFESHDSWTSLQNRIEIGDVHPGAFGVAALDLDASQKPEAHVRIATQYQRYGETNGTWHFNFWAKAKSGEPTNGFSAPCGIAFSPRNSTSRPSPP